jgi:hypothetical protein
MSKKKEFVDKEFKECKGGYYDEHDFYYTPNGSKRMYNFY